MILSVMTTDLDPAAIGEPVNRVLDVDLDGEEVTLTLYDWPSVSGT
jgi:hypothetical protein